MLGVTSYRWFSALMGFAYLALVASITYRPPASSGPDGPSVFERIYATGLWVPFFLAGALLVLYGAARRPKVSVLGHAFLMTIIAAFAIANAGNSLINASGWIVASLSLALVGGHGLAIRSRPLGV